MSRQPLPQQYSVFTSRVTELRQRANQLQSYQDHAQTEPATALLESLEQLGVAEEELRQQNEELQVARDLLEVERNRYQDLFDSALDAYFITDMQGRIKDVNRAGAAMLRRQRQELYNKPLAVYVAQEHRRAFRNVIGLIGQDRWDERRSLRLLVHTYKGDVMEVSMRASVIGRADGAAAGGAEAGGTGGAGIWWIWHDLTDRKRSDERLHLLVRHFSETQEAAHVGSWEWDVYTRMLMWSDELYRIYGLEPQEEPVSYNWFLTHVHPDDRDLVEQSISGALEGNTPFAIRHRLVRPDGQVASVASQGHAINSPDGAVTRIIGTVQDVTQREREEEEARLRIGTLEWQLIQRTAQLQELGEGRHETGAMYPRPAASPRDAANSPESADPREGVHQSDEDTRVERASEVSRISRLISSMQTPEDVLSALAFSGRLAHANRMTLLGFDEPWDEQAPRSCRVLASWRGSEDLPAMEVMGLVLHEHGFDELFSNTWLTHVEDVRADRRLNERARGLFEQLGTRSLTAFPLVAAGHWYGVLLVHGSAPGVLQEMDAHDLRILVDHAAVAVDGLRLRATLDEARRKVEQAGAEGLQSLGVISHELRTPLTSIKGFVSTLLADDVTWDAESQRDFLRTIDAEADRMRELIGNLVDLARGGAGMLEVQPRPERVADILASASARVQAVARTHQLVVDVPGDLPPVQADRQRVAQVIVNLVENAVKYSRPGSRIRIKARMDGKDAVAGAVRLSVTDQGKGIPPEERERVFQPFQRATRPDGPAGAGLGLAISKSIVEALGGRIWVEDRPGPGTTVTFTLLLA